jgi:glycosyltransferase involved in cell wall biosynthesis
MVTTFYPPFSYGGDGITVQRLARALVKAGHEVTVIHDVGAYAALGHEPKGSPGPDDGIETIALESRFPFLTGLLTHQTGRPIAHGPRLRRLLNDGAFDVVHFHNVSLMGGPALLSYAPHSLTLYTAHEHWLVCPTHVLWRHNRELCTGRQCFRCTIRHHRPPQVWRHGSFFPRQMQSVDAYIALSEFSRKKHQEFGFPWPMHVIPPVVAEPAPPRFGTSPHSRPYFFCVGRLEAIKGIQTVLPLFLSDAPADLLVAGAGSFEPELRRMAAGSPNVVFVGRLDVDELARYYAHAIGHIAASICYETFGNTIVESFQQSTPVVARRLGSFPELVEIAGAGLLFDDVGELRAVLQLLARDPALRNRLGAAGRLAYEQKYSERAVVPQYLSLVEGKLAERLASRGGRPTERLLSIT